MDNEAILQTLLGGDQGSQGSNPNDILSALLQSSYVNKPVSSLPNMPINTKPPQQQSSGGMPGMPSGMMGGADLGADAGAADAGLGGDAAGLGSAFAGMGDALAGAGSAVASGIGSLFADGGALSLLAFL